MDIVRLEAGAEAPDLTDRVRITTLNAQRYRWGGSVAYREAAKFVEGEDEYPTYEAAEADAISWAARQGAVELFIETDTA